MIVVSPYAKTGYVSHTQYEFGSILKFVEDTFELGRLGTTDARATSIADAFDFTQSPRDVRPDRRSTRKRTSCSSAVERTGRYGVARRDSERPPRAPCSSCARWSCLRSPHLQRENPDPSSAKPSHEQRVQRPVPATAAARVPDCERAW